MLGWFEWDEVHQCLRVVIPPWDCVDAPRQPADVVKDRQDELVKLIAGMSLNPLQRGAIKDYLSLAAHWMSEDLFKFALETMVCFVKVDALLLSLP